MEVQCPPLVLPKLPVVQLARGKIARLDFDFRPRAIIEQLDLLRPFYRTTTNYGHFGKADLPWER